MAPALLRYCGLATSLVVVGLSVLLYQALNLPSQQLHPAPVEQPAFDRFDWDAAAKRLGKALRIKTVSREPFVVSYPQNFLALHQHIEESFPLVHATLVREVVSNYTLLYTWEGTEQPTAGGGHLPYMLMSHLDVVPISENEMDLWDFEPFAGHVINGYIYGRGSMDDKSGVFGILEAVEALLREGHTPRRTVYLAFGHDEEVGGWEGNFKVVELLRSRGVRLDFVVDEGGIIGDHLLQGVEAPVAMIAISEKGSVDFELSVAGAGGHTSMPPPGNAVARLGAAVSRIGTARMPYHLDAVQLILRFMGAEMSFLYRFLATHVQLVAPLIALIMGGKPETNAQIRTVLSPTVISGSPKANVLPVRATCTVNARVVHGDTIQDVENWIRKTINDPSINVTRAHDWAEASPVSPHDCEQFRLIQTTIRQLFPDYLVAPFITTGATDSRHYYALTDHVYRFAPLLMTSRDLKRFHGINERIHLDDLQRCIRFYYQLLRNADAV